MPQLSPLNWLLSITLIAAFSATMISTLWWRQNLLFPSQTAPSLHLQSQTPWPWS